MALGRKFSVQPTLFYRRLWGLVMRNSTPNPPLAQALVQDGVGRAYGAQILLRFAPSPIFSGWVAYTLSRSERKHSGDASYRLLDEDQTHLLTAVANATFRGFVFGLRFRLATGMPRTPVIGSYLDATTGQYQPIFGAQNSIRLPVFYALDLRMEKVSILCRRRLPSSARRFGFHGSSPRVLSMIPGQDIPWATQRMGPKMRGNRQLCRGMCTCGLCCMTVGVEPTSLPTR
jgi:hypothetical protein